MTEVLLNQANKILTELVGGQVKDFRTAVSMAIKCCVLQKAIDKTLERPECEDWDKYIGSSTKALAIYEEEVKAAELKAIQRMREEGLTDFSKALEKKDYRLLGS